MDQLWSYDIIFRAIPGGKIVVTCIEPTESWTPHRYFPDDFQILPSRDITITVTSSWYFLRSPCGISSNSWKSIPATIESVISPLLLNSLIEFYRHSNWQPKTLSINEMRTTFCLNDFLHYPHPKTMKS